MAERFVVRVCYATAASEVWRDVEVEQGATIEQAIRSSGMLEAVPGIDLAGVVEHSVDPAWKPGDRVVVNGWGLGETQWGGFSQYARLSRSPLDGTWW